MLLISLLLNALWGVIRSERELLEPEVSEHEINAILVATTPSLGFYVGVIVLAIFAPRVAAFGYLVMAVSACSARMATREKTPDSRSPRNRNGTIDTC